MCAFRGATRKNWLRQCGARRRAAVFAPTGRVVDDFDLGIFFDARSGSGFSKGGAALRALNFVGFDGPAKLAPMSVAPMRRQANASLS